MSDELKQIIYDLNLKINNAKNAMLEADTYMTEVESKLCELMILELGVLLKQLFMSSKHNLVFKGEVLRAFMTQNNFILSAIQNNFNPVEKKEH